MAKKKSSELSSELRAVLKSDSISTEELAGAIAEGMLKFCEQLENNDVAPEIVNAVLFNVFVLRMQDLNDREGFEELIEEALEEEWTVHSLH